MKKRNTLISISLIMALIVSLLIGGCGKKDNQVSSVEENTGKDVSVQITVEDEKQDSDNEAAVEEDTITKPTATECNKAYQKFLMNEEKVSFDRYSELNSQAGESYIYTIFEPMLDGYESVNLAEFVEFICKAFDEDMGIRYNPRTIQYSYIDCGNDGVPELAIMMDAYNEYDDEYAYAVIKYMDDKLECVFLDGYSYRTYSYINEYGLYVYMVSYGAASVINEYSYIDENGVVNFDYGDVEMYSISALCDNDAEYDRLEKLAYEQGIEDTIQAEQFYITPYDSNQGKYTDYLKTCYFTYYEYRDGNDDYDRKLAAQEGLLEEGNPYRIFWDATGLPLASLEEIQAILDEHEAKIGITEEIRSGESANWMELSDSQMEPLVQWVTGDTIQVTLDKPSWEYYCYKENALPITTKTLEQISSTPNQITDDYVWFDMLGIVEPDRLNFYDNNYDYSLYGLDAAGLQWYPYMMDIRDSSSDQIIYTIDFSNYYYPEDYVIADFSYIEESIHWATIEDDILYVSTYHTTYASSAPQNGYITAFDMKNDFKVLWRTEPLTCNSDNFVIVDDAIICGYGFTSEPDYVYIVDKSTGARCGEYKVKTGPDFFAVDGNDLYVRCYDTDYVFSIK